jgi:trimeric autotransporter adhesin
MNLAPHAIRAAHSALHAHSRITQGMLVLCCALSGLAPSVYAQSAATRAPSIAVAHPSQAFWLDILGTPAAQSARGTAPSVQVQRFRALTLDRSSLMGAVSAAPMERSAAARSSPLVVSLPHPDGGFQRFTLVDSPVMEAGLAAKHPGIKTYAGRGIDDPSASLRLSITPLGLHASVRAPTGGWYIDPYYHLDQSLYASYYTRDAVNPRPKFAEPMIIQAQVALDRGRFHAGNQVVVRGAGFAAGAQVTVTVSGASDAAPRQALYAVAGADGAVSASFVAEPYKALGSYSVTLSDGVSSASASYEVVGDKASLNAAVGSQLRTYRLALLTDPAYATYFGGGANVTPAKVVLMNRVTQVYEDETSIRMVLIANNDALNLDTAAQFSGVNGPCGGTACYPTASVNCTSAVLTRTRQVIGLLVGASAFDVGHIAVGAGGGGIASLGVVGGNAKAQGCTGLPTPVGDYFAVDYVAHEFGHQFAGNHTYNSSVCSGQRNQGTSVEPGGGSSIMAYAGICNTDNIQSNSDPYWSQRSFDEVVAFASSAEFSINEVQIGVLSNFAGTQQFQLRYNGNDSVAIVRGTNFTAAGIQAAIQGIAGWPAGATVTVGTPTDTSFQVTFTGGAVAGVNVNALQLVNCTGGCTGYVGEIAKGGITARGGALSPTGNTAPLVSVAAASYTIPIRTPFALTGSATDADGGDVLTYMWEQNDRGNLATSLISNSKPTGPLFRQFGVRSTSVVNPLTYVPAGQNNTTTSPTRVFPDMLQVLANNTNAETGVCPVPAGAPTGPQIDCFSEFLPTVEYVGVAGVNASPLSLNFRLTARDGRGGINSADTQLVLAPGAGPFLVTSPNTAVTLDGNSSQTVTWNVANTQVAPVNTTNVKITLSVDGGLTWPFTLAASTPNDGSELVVMPNVGTTQARVRVEAVGNVFFDVSNADFTIRLTGDANGDGAVNCLDIGVVRAALGKRTGQPGFNPAADFNNDGVIDIRDLSYVAQRLAAGTRC